MKILVTGSSGFIGNALVDHLAKKQMEVLGLDRRSPRLPAPCRSLECDLLDAAGMEAALRDFQPEVVIHLAARTSLKEVHPGSDRYAPNTVGTGNLILAARAAGSVRRIIFTSTKYVHRGNQPANDRDYQPTTSYGRSKAEMEQLVWDQDGGVPEWCIARPTTVWGPGMGRHYQKFLGMLCKGYYFHIGHAEVKKHMAYVGNIVFQYAKLAGAPADQVNKKIFYLADYEPMLVREWAELLREALHGPKIRTIPMPLAKCAAIAGDVISHSVYRKFPLTSFRLNNLTVDDVCDVTTTRNTCGTLPYTAAQGARETADWYRSIINPRQ